MVGMGRAGAVSFLYLDGSFQVSMVAVEQTTPIVRGRNSCATANSSGTLATSSLSAFPHEGEPPNQRSQRLFWRRWTWTSPFTNRDRKSTRLNSSHQIISYA